MPRIVPSDVVGVIEQLFPEIVRGDAVQLVIDHGAAIRTVLTLVDQIPSELLPSQAQEYCALTIGLCSLRTALDHWADSRFRIVAAPGGSNTNPVQLIYLTLQQCPDAAPSPVTTELPFIDDAALREGLRLDISTAEQARANGEWKAATVLAGSVVEALLLWTLQQATAPDLQTACASVGTNGNLPRPPQGPLERWNLAEYIAVAEELTRIDGDTAQQASLAKDFRNLIHPGRAQRLAQVCDRGTAYAALAAVYMVIRCLTP